MKTVDDIAKEQREAIERDALASLRVEVGHPEMNIRTTMVLLLAQYAAGVIPAPLSVRMAPSHLLEDAWRAAAIAHLNGKTVKQEHEKKKHVLEGKYEELNEEFDWEERRGRPNT